MANQPYRQGRPGYPGHNRPVYGPGCPTPYSRRSGSHQHPADHDCPCDTSRDMNTDTVCEAGQHSHCGSQNNQSVICVSTEKFPVGMAYVPMQSWSSLYDYQKALSRGTLFPELDKPFIGRRACR